MSPDVFVHPMAVVDEDAEIGRGSRIWQFASVVRRARLGYDCNVASGATVDAARLGDRCIVGHNTLIPPGVWIEDDVFVGPNVVICNDSWPSTSKDGFSMEPLLSLEFIAVRVARSVSISAGVIILPGVTIGENSIIAAGAVVSHPVAANMLFFREGAVRSRDFVRERSRMRKA